MENDSYIGWLIDILPFVILCLHFTDKYLLSKGQLFPVYILTIGSSLFTVLYNCLLWQTMNGNHKSVLLFAINSSWTVIMSVKGIIRLTKEKRLKRLPKIDIKAVLIPAKYNKENCNENRSGRI